MSEAAEPRVGPTGRLSTAKVRIDLSAGTLEAEGTEDFIRELYQDCSERVTTTPFVPAADKGGRLRHAGPSLGRSDDAQWGTAESDRR